MYAQLPAIVLAQEPSPFHDRPINDRERLMCIGEDGYGVSNPVDAKAVLRREFRTQLSEKRIQGSFLPANTPPSCLSPEGTPSHEIDRIYQWTRDLLGINHVPEDVREVRWCAARPYSGHDSVAFIIGEWHSGETGIAIYGVPTHPGFRVRLTLSGNDRIPFRQYSHEALESVGIKREIVGIDEDKLFSVLKEYFQCPYSSVHDYENYVGSLVYEGVRFHPGRLRSNVRLNTDDPNVQPYDSPSPWANVILFITDTEPQYVCLTFDLRKGAPSQER